jgi:lipid A 3-O-deacylase
MSRGDDLRGTMRAELMGLGAAGLLAFAPIAAHAAEPDLLAVGAGAYNVLHQDKEAQMRLEYRFSYRFLYIIRPILGGFGTERGTLYGYGGIRLDAEIGRHLVITPEGAVGAWRRGSNKTRELGGPIEFKSGGEIAYRFDNDARLGLLFDHISNAGLYKKNPGVESALLVYSIPLHW